MKQLLEVAVPEKIWWDLRRRFLASAPLEDGAFLTASWAPPILTIKAVVEPRLDGWDWQAETSLKPSTAYLNRAAAQAQSSGLVAVFVHTHPMGWAEFSGADEWAHEAWAPFFQRNSEHGCFASLVWGMGRWSASIWTPSGRLDSKEVRVNG